VNLATLPLLAAAFVLNKNADLPEVSGFPVAQIGFLKQGGTGDTPAELGAVGESNAKVENAFLKGVVCPMDHLPFDAWILLALHHFVRRQLLGGHFSLGHVSLPSLAPLRGQGVRGSAGLSHFVLRLWFAHAASGFWSCVLQGLLEDYVLFLLFFRL
jgi:hypothetical protein